MAVPVEYLPTPHAMQSPAAVIPTPLEYLPTGQAMQLVTDMDPVAGRYVPAGHFWHDTALALSLAYVPMSHARHCNAEVQLLPLQPCEILYVPPLHGLHGPPFGPQKPGSQVQFVPVNPSDCVVLFCGHWIFMPSVQ